MRQGRKNIRRLCAIADVSPKCFYQYRKGPSRKEIKDNELMSLIMGLQKAYGNSLGYRKMADRLEEDHGIKISRKKALKLMEECSSLSAVRRKHLTEEQYKTRREIKETAPPDLIGRNFFSIIPNSRYVCDITYLTGCDETWYLNSIEDLYNGEIVAWKIGEHCTASLCIETVEMLKGNVPSLRGCILHSDGGSTYNAYGYRGLLSCLGIRQSMGMKLTCFDNARIESFNGVLKTEALYCNFGKTKVKNRGVHVRELAAKVEEFIPYYNNLRKKDSLGHMSPVEFRKANPHGTYLAFIENYPLQKI